MTGLDLSNLFPYGSPFPQVPFLSLRQAADEEEKRRREQERQRKLELAKSAIKSFKDVVRKVGETPTGATEESLLFGVAGKPKEETIRIKEFFQPKSYLGGRVGKGLAEDISAGFMATLPQAAPIVGAFRPTLKGIAAGTGVATGLQAGLTALRGEKQKPKELAGAAAFGALVGSFVPKPLKSASVTELGRSRKVLGISPNATVEEIKASYYGLARKYHPDVGGTQEKMAEINRAFEVVSSEKPPSGLNLSGISDWLTGVFRPKPKPAPEKPTLQLPRAELPPAPAVVKPPTLLQPPLEQAPAIPIPPEPRATVRGLEKTQIAEKFRSLLSGTENVEDYAMRVKTIADQLKKPEVANDRQTLKDVRALVADEIRGLTGSDISGNYKLNFAALQAIKDDPEVAPGVEALENLIADLDDMVGPRIARKTMEMVRTDLNLPIEGKFHIPYGRYSTRGTGNREWVQENIPLLYMGNKRGMAGYILDVLGIQQKDLGSIVPADVKQLSGVSNVVDLFGGSGLLSNLSKKFFPEAKVTYNELDPRVLKAIQKAQTDPKPLQNFVSQVAKYLSDNPGADWLAHFGKVYKGDPNFLTAARLIEAAAGRTDLTPLKLNALIKAIPNFSKTFKGVSVTNEDALKLMDKYIREGSKSDFLWIDPPYIWSTGYNVGVEMERASGFLKLLDKLDKLNEKGVKFVFFNNDPEIQAKKAGLEAVHLDNILGRINQLSEKGMIVVRDINPVGVAERREMMITNLQYGVKSGRLLNLQEVQKAIVALAHDPAAAPKEVLKMYRDLRGISRFVPEGERISAGQIRMARALRKNLRIRNREMEPVLDEILGDRSFAKMTKEDGQRLIEWLQPRNWDVIEKKIELTREMDAKEKAQAVLGDRFVAKNEELEKKYGVMGLMNKTVGEIENLSRMVQVLPMPEAPNWNKLRRIAAGGARYMSEDMATKILGIRTSFHVPMRTLIKIGNVHTNRMKKGLGRLIKDLSKNERKQVAFLQGGAEKYYTGPITPRAREVASYFQNVFKSHLELVNRLRRAAHQKPLPGRDPYIPYIIDQDLAMASNLLERNKFWEMRTKTPRDFAAGLFNQDLSRIIEIWAESSGNWMKKNLYGALMMERADKVFKVSDSASAYVNEMVNLDIYDMVPDSQKLLRSVGNATNEFVGSIFPRKIPVNEELARSILNTRFGQELKDQISGGYLMVPRVQVPNISTAFHRVFYPAKLAWNFGFYLLNRTQPWAGLPFVGIESQITGKLRLFATIFPWNVATRKRHIQILEESGYEFGRIVASHEIPSAKGTIGKIIDRSVNFVGDVSELANRLENMYGAESFLTKAEKKLGPLPKEDKERIAATFSAYINFLSGKGYAPLAQRSPAGRFIYTFQQYSVNQINVYHDMLRYAFKDEGAKEFWQTMAREGGATEETVNAFGKLPPASKANLFLIFLAIALPVATLYALSRSWNIASRALPGVPFDRIAANDMFSALLTWADQNTDDNKDKLISEVKKFFSITSKERLDDALEIYDYGMLTSSVSNRPIFARKSLEDALGVFVFGRSFLEEYTKRFPSWLARTFGGYREAGRVKELEQERKKIRKEETKNAVELLKKLRSFKSGQEAGEFLKKFKQEGKLTGGTRDKLKEYLKEQAAGVGGLERSIVGLNDADQATFILEKLRSAKSADEAAIFLKQYKEQGIMTDNVRKEMRKLAGEGK